MVEGEKVRLRCLTVEDLPYLEQWDGDEEIVRYIGKKFTRKRHPRAWFASITSDRRRKALAIETRLGRMIGNLELEDINWKAGIAELRICIGEKSFWNQGYGTDAVNTFLGHAFGQLGLKTVFLRVYRHNRRAVACYERCGFRKEGLLRGGTRQDQGFEDLYLMVARKSDWHPPTMAFLDTGNPGG